MAKRRNKKRTPYDPTKKDAQREKARAAERARLRADGIDVSVAEIDGVELSHARQAELEAKGCIVEVDHRRRLKSAVAPTHHKADIWWRLHTREGLTRDQLNAVRDLQDLMARRAGVGGRDEKMSYERDKTDEPFRDPCLVSDDMLRAGVEMDLTLSLVGPPSSRLLAALLWPAVLAEPHDWREIVARVTGEKNPHAQCVPLRIAAQALVDVRPQVQRMMARAGKGKAERADPQALGALEPASVRMHPFQAGPGR